MTENHQARLLSVTTRTTLCNQHALSLKQLDMEHYLKTDNYDAKALTMRLNSLLKLSHLTTQDMSNYVLQLDEVASFLEFTHNDTLDNKLRELMAFLLKFVRHAGKVVCLMRLSTTMCSHSWNAEVGTQCFCRTLSRNMLARQPSV